MAQNPSRLGAIAFSHNQDPNPTFPLILQTWVKLPRRAAHLFQRASISNGFGGACRRSCHRRKAIIVHTASTTPKGHAPCKKPYADARAHAPANARMNHVLRSSRA